MKRKLPLILAALGLTFTAPAAMTQELVVGWSAPNDTLNPVTTGRRDTGPILSNIFDTLVWLTPDFKVEPLLATEWSVSEDRLSYTFKLREDVAFHDGTPFNAAAVVRNFEYIMDPDTQSKISLGLLGPCRTAEATGEFELKITCGQPYGALLAQIGEPYLGIQSPAAIETYGADLGQHPVGTGPFRFVELMSDDSVVLERNPDYNWMAASLNHEGPANIEKITFQVVTNSQARVSQFQSGQSHVMHRVPGLHWKTLGASGRYNTYEVPISGLGIFAPINASTFPTDDLAVRKAILHAVDQEGVVQLAEAGVFPVSRTPLTEGLLGHDPALAEGYGYDPEKVAEVLEAAGWTMGSQFWEKDGRTLSLKITAISENASYMALAQAIQGYLAAVNIEATLEPMTSPAWNAANIAGEMNLTPLQYIAVDPDALRFWFTEGQYFNWSHWTDPAFTELLDEAVALADEGARAEAYREAQRILLDNAVILPIRQNLDLTMSAKNVTGITWSGGGFQYFGAVKIED
ncbi:ABC transporter substrate-binding protein [Szabonella alba]|uniref:Solute-binding protein family 5 domain-containing protein n=1 Tax=Szabonella alba TaxID=2804194 RepID=A0A8K0VBM9_9RHOB|nr:ABC transporter substrate-binding protein [Szabonella alba]MBL4916784.1 hypothetical protein [Szabonella alba]